MARLDERLVTLGLTETRSKARALVLAGRVRVNGTPVDKAGAPVREEARIEIEQPPRFVSRGGEKLDSALAAFGLDVAGRVALDAGASTGGFTDRLLQGGATRVHAVDVGRSQLHERVASDPRVVVHDRVNVRHLEIDTLGERVDLITADLAFISLRTVLPALLAVLNEGGEMVLMVKPQFEADRAHVRRGGVVIGREGHEQAIRAVISAAADLGLACTDVAVSGTVGPAGNLEYFVRLSRPQEGALLAAPADLDAAIERALSDGQRLLVGRRFGARHLGEGA